MSLGQNVKDIAKTNGQESAPTALEYEKTISELKLEKAKGDDMIKALSIETNGLRAIIVQMTKERYGLK